MDEKILYFDCFSGVSGDMTIGALLDLGVSEARLAEEIAKLGIDGYDISVKKDIKNGITGSKFDVILKEGNCLNDNGSEHHHRTYKDIKKIITDSCLSDRVKEDSLRIFEYIAHSEGRIHGKSIDEVHFHEVGAIDSIIDAVGAAICMEELNVTSILCSPINVGSGFVRCAHGIFPVPAPATLDILKGIPIYSKGVDKELTTPTGAGIVKAFSKTFGEIPDMIPEKIGYGLGTRTFEDYPNVLRVVLGKKKRLSGC